MMSLMALAGFAFGGIDGGDAVDTTDDDYLYEQEGWAQDLAHNNLVDPSILNDSSEAVNVAPGSTAPTDVYEFDRGDIITGFDPATDQIELEYTTSLGIPDVTVTDFADGTGASIALNGVVVADVPGAQGIEPNTISLIAV